MSLHEFQEMSIDMRATITWEMGEYLLSREEGPFNLALYHVFGFYVEVWYHTEENEITQLRSFSSVHQLDPYLQQISLRHIFST